MSSKMCYDVYMIGKNAMALFRSLLTFSGALFISMNSDKYQAKAETFDNFDTFERKVVTLPVEADT